ncbi:hypothetical protein, partial [Rahnella sp. CJA17(1/100)]|uniref:hypothetical protein n=1 Tax=Rahnella sp. CJA17(1/100) TaxID=2508951 RepID=UPI00197E2EE4
AVPDIERIAGKCVHSGPWLTCEKHPAFRGVRKLYSHGEIVGILYQDPENANVMMHRNTKHN